MGKTAKASSQGLEKVKQAALKKGWRKTSPAFLDAACVSAATLKRFWRGVAISLDSFSSICQAVNIGFEQVLENENALIISDSGDAITPSATQPSENRPSRQNLRHSLYAQLLNPARILAITGLPGIGKKTLARSIASDLADDGYACINLSCEPTVPLTLAAIAHTLSKASAPSNFAFNFSELQNRLASQKYLFVINHFEHLLESALDAKGNLQSNIWRNFFQSVLETNEYASRFLLISEDVPNEICLLSWRIPERWHLCALAGLTPPEQLDLFQSTGIATDTTLDNRETAELNRCIVEIGLAYAGHPLALQTIAHDIARNFQNDVTTYYERYASYLRRNSATKSDDKTPPSTNLHSHSLLLQQQVQPGLLQSITRLKQQVPDAFKLLGAASYSDYPISTLAWMQMGQGIGLSPVRCRSLLEVLSDRAFLTPIVQDNQLHYQLHPLVRSLMLTQIQ